MVFGFKGKIKFIAVTYTRQHSVLILVLKISNILSNEIANDENQIVDEQVKYFRDTYAEHPDDRENIEYSVFLDGDDALVTLSGMYEQGPLL